MARMQAPGCKQDRRESDGLEISRRLPSFFRYPRPL